MGFKGSPICTLNMGETTTVTATWWVSPNGTLLHVPDDERSPHWCRDRALGKATAAYYDAPNTANSACREGKPVRRIPPPHRCR